MPARQPMANQMMGSRPLCFAKYEVTEPSRINTIIFSKVVSMRPKVQVVRVCAIFFGKYLVLMLL